jgi:fermentation-respiration switch protein FrsA (DUF1100 family)
VTEPDEIAFPAEDGVMLRGSLYRPGRAGPRPAITMSAGFGGVRQQGLLPFVEAFTAAGFVVLLHDHRGFGSSGGEPRQDIDPWQQIHDWRRALAYLQTRPEVDADRIGLWGTSYSGGHALVLGATDRRLRAVVAQVPTISGHDQGLRRVPPERVAAVEDAFNADDRAQLGGEPPHYQALVAEDPSVPAFYYASEAVEFYLRPIPEDPGWENTATLRSARKSRMYEPGLFITRVSPTPLLLVVAGHDTLTPTDLALTAYELALQPKRLHLVPGGHFEPYLSQFYSASRAAVQWFTHHLQQGGSP